jgi:hypothetical protein
VKELIRNILKEETEENDQKVMNFLLRRYRTSERDFGEEGHPRMFKQITFEIDEDFYVINNFQNKTEQVHKIFNMLVDNDVIKKPIEFYGTTLDPYRQKVIRTIRKFLNDKIS